MSVVARSNWVVKLNCATWRLSIGNFAELSFSFPLQFTTSEAIQSSRASEKLSSSPATDVVVTAHPSSLTYLRQIFEHDQVGHQGQIVSVLPHGMTSPLSPTLPELHRCKWDSCCEHFLSLEDLVAHVNEYHIRTEASEYCCLWQGCARNGKGFNARYKMLIHMRTHTGERPHRCNHDSCGKSFSRLENLKIHTRSHTGEKPYVCPVAGCNKRYSNSSDRYKHTRTHSETKPYPCKVANCFKRYTDPSSLRKHYKTIHGKDMIAEEQEWSRMPYLIIIVNPSRFLAFYKVFIERFNSSRPCALSLEFHFPNKRKTSLSGWHYMKAVFHSRLSVRRDSKSRLRREPALLPVGT